MPTTYETLKNNALILTDNEGALDIGGVAEIALHEAMKYVATKVRLDALTGEATYTVDSDDVTNQYVELSDFSASNMDQPLELWVAGSASETGSLYRYIRYSDWRKMRYNSSASTPLFRDNYNSNLPSDGSFTLDLNNRLKIFPFPIEGRVLTLCYQKELAAYSNAGFPELQGPWTSILTNGAVLYINKFLKEGEEALNPYLLFQQLDSQIDELNIALESPFTTPTIKIHKSYRA